MEHLPLVNLIDWHMHNRVTPAKTLQFAPLSFDISFHEIFSTWCSGGTLVLISEEQRRNPEALFNVILTQGVEKIYLPFAALQQLQDLRNGAIYSVGKIRQSPTVKLEKLPFYLCMKNSSS